MRQNLNQWIERKEDALMARTASRPLPAKLVTPELALRFGIALSVLGLLTLWIWTNPWATLLTFTLIYLVIYTPLKKKSPIAIEVEPLLQGQPPLIGWVVAAGSPTTYGFIFYSESYLLGNFHILHGHCLESSQRLV